MPSILKNRMPVLSDVHSDSECRPISRFECWLLDLKDSWTVCMFRIAAVEIRNCYRRIATIQSARLTRFGYALPSLREIGQRKLDLAQENIVLRARSDGIKELAQRRPWMGTLDREVTAEAFRMGLIWGAVEMNSALTYTESRNKELAD